MTNVMSVIINFINEYLVHFAVSLVCAALILLIGLKLVKVLTKKLAKSKAFQKMDSSVSSLILNTIKVLLNALIIIVAVQILGVPSATIIAALGSCGLAVGLALQGGLSNLAGGVMIMVFKPFHIGDYISTSSGEGTVEDIGLFYTKLATVDNRLINIPNSALSSTTVRIFRSRRRGESTLRSPLPTALTSTLPAKRFWSAPKSATRSSRNLLRRSSFRRTAIPRSKSPCV